LAQVEQNVFGTNNSATAAFGSATTALSYYMQVAQQIASATNSNGSFNLYGSFSGPQLSAIQQGALGDCFYMSAVDSILNENPQLISKMIVQNANGTFTVSFPTGTKETVTLTDSDIANFSIATNNGAWLAVMGLAENNVLVGLSTSSNKQTAQAFAVTSSETATPLGVVSDGGYPTQTLNVLTGQAYNAISSSQRQTWTVTNVDKLLTTDFTSGSPIGVDSTDHSLAIIGWNASTQTVTILNPWGVSGPYGYAEDPGVSNYRMQVQMVNGVFTLTTQQMLQDFSEIVAPASLLGLSGTITSAPHGIASSASNMIAPQSQPSYMVATSLPNISALISPSVSLASIGQSNLSAATQIITSQVSDSASLSASKAKLDTLNSGLTSNSSQPASIVESRHQSAGGAMSDQAVVDTGEYCIDQADEEITASR
jgi:hypothetical protein